MKLIILGPPASGKGTQAKLLVQKLNLKHISTGDLIRNEINNKTQIGLKLKSLTEKGALAPTDIITSLLKKYLPRDNYILDGYPRSEEQVKILKTITDPDFIIDIEVPDNILIGRITSRRTCPLCGAIYGLVIQPKKKGYCDNDSARLIQRKDDTEETAKTRLEVYKQQSAPVVKEYREKLIKVNGTPEPKIILVQILSKIQG